MSAAGIRTVLISDHAIRPDPGPLILRAGRRLTEVPPPIVAKAEELGRDAGKAAASPVFEGSTPEEAYQRVLRGIDDGDPAVLDAVEPPPIGPAAGYTEDDLARDLGIDPRDRALPRAVPAYADAFTSSFWQQTERAAAATPARSRPGPAVRLIEAVQPPG